MKKSRLRLRRIVWKQEPTARDRRSALWYRPNFGVLVENGKEWVFLSPEHEASSKRERRELKA